MSEWVCGQVLKLYINQSIHFWRKRKEKKAEESSAGKERKKGRTEEKEKEKSAEERWNSEYQTLDLEGISLYVCMYRGMD